MDKERRGLWGCMGLRALGLGLVLGLVREGLEGQVKFRLRLKDKDKDNDQTQRLRPLITRLRLHKDKDKDKRR